MDAIAGLAGLALFLLAFGALVFGALPPISLGFLALNILAAALLTIAALGAVAPIAVVLALLAWIALALGGLARLWRYNRVPVFSERERMLLERKLGNIPIDSARRFLRTGRWVEGKDGDMLTDQGTPITHLYYLATATAAVAVNGQTVGRAEAGSFIGELSALSDTPANATVTLIEPGLYFEIDAMLLRRLVRNDPTLGAFLNSSFAQDTGEKLKAMNLALASEKTGREH
jgi:hypothetical protein